MRNTSSHWFVFSGFAVVLACSGCIHSGDVSIPLPLLPIVLLNSERTVLHLGGRFLGGSSQDVSDQFTKDDLRSLYATLHTEEFQAPLTRYSRRHPHLRFKFNLTLTRYPDKKTNALQVSFGYSPELDPAIPEDRDLESTIFDRVREELAKLEAAHPKQNTQPTH